MSSRKSLTNRRLPKRKRIARPRKLAYKHLHALHRYEEDLIVAALCTLGYPANHVKLDDAFPGRFDKKLLFQRMKALVNSKRIRRSGIYFHRHPSGRISHMTIYTPVYGPHWLLEEKRTFTEGGSTVSWVLDISRSIRNAESTTRRGKVSHG